MKCIAIPEENLLSRGLLRQCNIDGPSGVAQAYLLGQLVRSKASPKGFGELLIDFAMKKVKEAKSIVGCRILRIDCSDDLVGYYKGHGFRLIRKNPDKGLNQMIALVRRPCGAGMAEGTDGTGGDLRVLCALLLGPQQHPERSRLSRPHRFRLLSAVDFCGIVTVGSSPSAATS